MLIKLEETYLYLQSPKSFSTKEGLVNSKLSPKKNLFVIRKSGQINPTLNSSQLSFLIYMIFAANLDFGVHI